MALGLLLVQPKRYVRTRSEGPRNEKMPCAGAPGARDLLTRSNDRVVIVSERWTKRFTEALLKEGNLPK